MHSAAGLALAALLGAAASQSATPGQEASSARICDLSPEERVLEARAEERVLRFDAYAVDSDPRGCAVWSLTVSPEGQIKSSHVLRWSGEPGFTEAWDKLFKSMVFKSTDAVWTGVMVTESVLPPRAPAAPMPLVTPTLELGAPSQAAGIQSSRVERGLDPCTLTKEEVELNAFTERRIAVEPSPLDDVPNFPGCGIWSVSVSADGRIQTGVLSRASGDPRYDSIWQPWIKRLTFNPSSESWTGLIAVQTIVSADTPRP